MVLVALLACACLTPRPALAQELLQNGAFEDGAAPWTGCGGVSIVDRNDAGTTAAMVFLIGKPQARWPSSKTG